MNPPELRTFALTALIGTAGALVAFFLAFPAPFLIGPAVAITLSGLGGLRLKVPVRLRDCCFIVVGVSMGTTVTPDVILAAKRWPLSFVMVVVAVVILLFLASFILQRVFSYDRTTSLLAAAPGHLSYVLSLAAETRGDVRSVSVIQSVRVLALTITVPLIVEIFDLASTEPLVLYETMGIAVLLASLAASAVFGLLFLRLRFPAALLLGGVLVSISTHVTGMVSGGVPMWLLIPTYVILGSMIGTRFSGVSLRELRAAFVAGGVITLVVTGISAAIAGGVSYFLDVPLAAAFIAFAPGGLETMAAMAVMLHADPTYVGAHHVLRLMLLSVLMPLVLGKAARGR